MGDFLGFFQGLPEWLVYVVLGVGAALENLIPPVPADTFVLLGGFLAARGVGEPVWVFVATWGANVASALAVWWAGRHYGSSFFRDGPGRRVLREGQLKRIEGFYERWGIWAIFLTRFLPGLRAVVPAFAGVSRMSFPKVAIPLAGASAVWYGALTWLGATAGRNLEAIRDALSEVNLGLVVVASAIFGGIGVWWWRTRHGDGDEG